MSIDLASKQLLIFRARAQIGVSIYRRNATLDQAPDIVNCFRMTQWLYSLLGIILPDQQLICHQVTAISLDEIGIADLVFVPRRRRGLQDDFGHVGMATGEATVIHANAWRKTVVEDSLLSFIEDGCLGVRRIQL